MHIIKVLSKTYIAESLPVLINPKQSSESLDLNDKKVFINRITTGVFSTNKFNFAEIQPRKSHLCL